MQTEDDGCDPAIDIQVAEDCVRGRGMFRDRRPGDIEAPSKAVAE